MVEEELNAMLEEFGRLDGAKKKTTKETHGKCGDQDDGLHRRMDRLRPPCKQQEKFCVPLLAHTFQQPESSSEEEDEAGRPLYRP